MGEMPLGVSRSIKSFLTLTTAPPMIRMILYVKICDSLHQSSRLVS